jgi:hypothetical protein
MKRVKVLWLGMVLSLAACFVGSCVKDDGGGGSDYYMQFKYNGKSYKITSSILAHYTRDEMFGAVSYRLLAAKESISIQIDVFHELEAGESYDILTPASVAIPPDILIVISSGGEDIDESYRDYDREGEKKVGELTITKLTEKVMEGKFFCKTNNGEITDGKFKLRYEDGMGSW